ncbi:MAG: hypothetical protein IJ725_05055 [Ruminococcus sp.]|nr:hypothetical protein [Ruminococcus sp.]
MSDTNDTNATISDIPIQINLSDDAVDNGLQIFTGNDQKAAVTVSGNRLTIGSISKEDIIVSAPTAGTISTSGTYPLSLTAKKANSSDRFDIVSTVSPSVITIFVDQFKETNFDIINKITYKVSKGYHAVVTTSAESITVSGPQSEVDKVASVGIVGEISGELKDNTSLECDVKLYDNSGSVITSNLLTLSDEKVTANFSVLPYKEVPINIAFKNKPDGLDMSNYSTILPDKIKIAAPQEILDKLTAINTTAIDFSTLKNQSYDFEQKLDIPSQCVNISDNQTVDVKINLSSFKTRTIKITSDYFSMTGLSDEYSYSIATNSLNVTFVGPKSQISKITADDLTCEIDGSSIEDTTGSITLPVSFKVNNNSSCWATGSYKVNITVEK